MVPPLRKQCFHRPVFLYIHAPISVESVCAVSFICGSPWPEKNGEIKDIWFISFKTPAKQEWAPRANAGMVPVIMFFKLPLHASHVALPN
jgi:hypothetical protein